jgi:mycofactocin system glycosyltransferase
VKDSPSHQKTFRAAGPVGFVLGWDTRTRVKAGYRILMGGSPWRMVRLDDRAAAFARKIHAAGSLGASVTSDWELKAARELMARGFLYPMVATVGMKIDESQVQSSDYCVVIPVLDRAKQLAELLKLVRVHNSGAREIIVVDDGSQNASEIAEVAASSGAHLVRILVNAGPGAARNSGANQTSKPFIAFLDSDCMPTAMWVEQLLHHFKDPAIGVVAPRVKAIAGESSVMQRFEVSRSSLDMGGFPDDVKKGGRLAYIPSAAMVVRREVLDSINFEESMRVGEDVDFIWRVLEAGWGVRYDPSVLVGHRSRAGLRSWFIRTFEYGTSAAPLEYRHPDSLAPARFSGWNVGIVAGLVFDKKIGALTICMVAISALAWRLQHLPRPIPLAAQIVFYALMADIEQAGRVLRREWWPVGLLFLASVPKSKMGRRGVLIMFVPVIIDWRLENQRLDPCRYALMRYAQDLAYGSGVITSAVRAQVWRPLQPKVSYPVVIASRVNLSVRQVGHKLGSSKTFPKFSRFVSKRWASDASSSG